MENFTITPELGKSNLDFVSGPGLSCTHGSHQESGALPRCQFVEAMPLE